MAVRARKAGPRLRSARIAQAELAAALEAIGAAVVIARANGTTAHANEAATALLDGGGRGARRELVAAIAQGGSETWSCTPIAGASTHFLLVRRVPRRTLQGRLASAAALWRLTPRQTEVLGRVVQGDANKAIALHLECALVTVEVHVTALLAKSGCDGRAQLVAKFWTLE